MNKSLFTLIGFALVCGLTSGCKSARPEAMVPKAFVTEQKHNASIGVAAPKDPKAEWTFKLTSEAFTEALTKSLEKSGAFSRVVSSPEADYILEVVYVKGDQPAMGFNMTVDLVTKWTLTKKAAADPIFQENISSTYTAKLGEAFAGVTRVRKASEGAARENIKEGIRRLSLVKL